MNENEIMVNDCSFRDNKQEPHSDLIKWLKISEEINNLENMVSDLEKALHMNDKK